MSSSSLHEFARAMYAAAPALPDALRDAGEPTDPDPDFPILWLGRMGAALVGLLPSISADEARSAFEVVEQSVAAADDSAGRITSGLLEELATAVVEGDLSGPALARLLGLQSRAYLEAWSLVTHGRSILAPPGWRELEEFTGELYGAVPGLPAALVADDEPAEPDYEIPTSWLGGVGSSLARLLPSLDPSEAHSAFAVIERHLARDQGELGTGIATGLLEALANAVSRGTLSGPALAELLGPESRSYIDAWDQFTLGRSSLQAED